MALCGLAVMGAIEQVHDSGAAEGFLPCQGHPISVGTRKVVVQVGQSRILVKVSAPPCTLRLQESGVTGPPAAQETPSQDCEEE